MPRVRKIECNPTSKNYFIVDTCFFANKYIAPAIAPNGRERDRIEKCQEWWKEIDRQLDKRKARVYVPDICIAETFKTLAKKYYREKWFKTSRALNKARRLLTEDIETNAKTLMAYKRIIRYHDISTSRDIIIAVDRFYETFMKHGKDVSITDLIILATAKYLMDFYDIPKNNLHIVTLDNNLYQGLKLINELPNGYNPTLPSENFSKIFR
ncbi:MAG: hypothetical protein Q7T57_08805 [Dehalococcoidales bacterium]|nr:hypothetical protein [Dehalococcoidales bacterium]